MLKHYLYNEEYRLVLTSIAKQLIFNIFRGPIGKTMKKMLGHKKDPIFQFQAPGAKENFPRPTRNECDQWSHSFSALLNHKCINHKHNLTLTFNLIRIFNDYT